MNRLAKIKNWYQKRSLLIRLLLPILILGTVYFSYTKITAGKSSAPQYQTASAAKENIVSSISASGTISSANNSSITTKASGTVVKVYVKNGDTVKKGQKLADITLDDDGVTAQSQAWLDYIQAGQAVKKAQSDQAAADVQMWKDRQAIFDAIDAIDYKNNNTVNPATKEDYTDSEKTIIDKTLISARAAFDLSEQKFKDSGAAISEAQVLKAAAWRDYQEVSSGIYAPSNGKVANLTLTPGVIVTSTTDDNGKLASKEVGNIESSEGQIQAKVSLTEVDVPKVKADQKVSLTMDAYPDMTFTGKVLSVNTTGASTSGVTSYSVIILIDPTTVNLYPNMAVAANIITDFKNDVLAVPSSAIQSQDGSYYVLILKDGQVANVTVTTGITGDSKTEITSGLNEGGTVVTSVTTKTSTNSTTNQRSSGSNSVFGGGFGGGGGAVRIMR